MGLDLEPAIRYTVASFRPVFTSSGTARILKVPTAQVSYNSVAILGIWTIAEDGWSIARAEVAIP